MIRKFYLIKFFFFNRLSIIDLKAENQPYYNSDKSVVMMCNGEIYNYKYLKKFIIKGYKFKATQIK